MIFNSPLPIFDSIEYLTDKSKILTFDNPEFKSDYKIALKFLKSYKDSEGTFNSYRREVERLLHWSWLVAKKAIKDLKREHIEQFIKFCQDPPSTWIGIKKAPRFIEKEGSRVSNMEWRPFVITVTKSAHKQGKRPQVKHYQVSQGATKECFAILSSFFNYCLQEEYTLANPVALIRQKSKFIRKMQSAPKIRRLSDLQWQMVIKTVRQLADKNPALHQRTLFILSALYLMYLRISELAASKRWVPLMNHFYRDHDNHWWFKTVGKSNKERQIAVSDSMLQALKDYRKFLGFSALPTLADNSPLLPKIKGKGPVNSTHYLREIIQTCFDESVFQLRKKGEDEEADALMAATVHWLRHTGISDDVKRRPREHVRDDAGHSSSAVTDKYIDIELKERHKSARDKEI